MVGPLGLLPEAVPWDEARDGPEPVEPSDAELIGAWPDPFAGPPDGTDAWLSDLTPPELDLLARQHAAAGGPDDAEPFGAGFTHNLAPAGVDDAKSAVGFEAGGALDVMEPDSVLAGFVDDACETGLGKLSDDELIGLLCAARRLSSWQAAAELTAVIELDRRRRRGSDTGSSRATEHIQAELGTALTLTSKSAEAFLSLSRDLARLPMVLSALSKGIIDLAKAKVFATELATVNDVLARAIAAALWRPARRMTTGKLRAEIRALILSTDADAIRRRRERARDDARVEVWQEGSGNHGIAGRELPTAEVITADRRISALARALKQAGVTGTMDQVRAAVFIALLTGRDLTTLIPVYTSGAEGTSGKAQRPVPTEEKLAAITGTVHLTIVK